MANKNDEFIEFPDNYSKRLQDLIDYCNYQYNINSKNYKEYKDGFNVCKKRIKYSFKSLNENNILTKNYSQLYLKYCNLHKQVINAQKNTDESANPKLDELKKQKETTKIAMKKLADEIKKNNYGIVHRYNEIRQSLDSIKENFESYIAKKNAYEMLRDDLDSYSSDIDIITTQIKGYKELEKLEENGIINNSYEGKLNEQKEKIIKKCQMVEGDEEHIKLQLMRLIAIGDKDLQTLLTKWTELKRLQPKLKISYNVNDLIVETTSNINYSLLERDMKKLKTISDNLSKINKQWDSKK